MVTVEEYLQMIELKTAALMAAGVEAAATLVPRSDGDPPLRPAASGSRSRWPTT